MYSVECQTNIEVILMVDIAFRTLPGRTGKTAKNINRDSQYHCQDSNQVLRIRSLQGYSYVFLFGDTSQTALFVFLSSVTQVEL
jgi:hypothetical protein